MTAFENPEQFEPVAHEEPGPTPEQVHVDQDIEHGPEQVDEVPDEAEGAYLEMGPDRKKILEESGEKRSGILNEFMTSEVVNQGLNVVPYVGGTKMVHESIVGRDMSGKELSGAKRVIHGGVGAASMTLDFVSPGLEKPGMAFGANVVKTEGETALIMGKIGETISDKGDEKSGRVFARTGKFMADHPEDTSEAERYADRRINDSRTLLESGV